MSEESLSVAVLFADISQSTLLYKTLGDSVAQKVVGDCLRLLSDLATRHQGRVIKTIGDAVLCVFPEADLAVDAAKAMQLALAESPLIEHPQLTGPFIHVGIHLGPVLCKDEDVFGDAVNIAADLMRQANPQQILATEETVSALRPEAKGMTRPLGTTTVKGKREEYGLYEIVWAYHEVTVVVRSAATPAHQDSRLVLSFHDQTIELGRLRPGATMGRHRQNDLVVDDVLVSRIHARIEYRKGRFLLVDMSTNGTYLVTQGEGTTCLHRDERPLQGRGVIGLGREVELKSPVAIHFTCEP